MIQEELFKTKEGIILVVDDCPHTQTAVETILSEQGYKNILKASSGSEALSIINERNPDLVLLDVMIPEIDGFEVCSRLHSGKETADIPVIMLTAKISSEDLKKGFEVGAFDYIEKPFDNIGLIASIESALNLKQSKEDVRSYQNEKVEKKSKKNNRNIDGSSKKRILKLERENIELRREIAKHSQIEVALRESAKRYSAIVEECNDGIVILDGKKFVFVNQNVADLTGYSVEELYKLKFNDVFFSNHRHDILDSFFSHMAKKDQSPTYKLEALQKDGNTIPIEINGTWVEHPEKRELLILLRGISECQCENEKSKEKLGGFKHSKKEFKNFAYATYDDLGKLSKALPDYLQLLYKRIKNQYKTNFQKGTNSPFKYSQLVKCGKPFETTDCETVLEKALRNLTITIEEKGAVITHDPMPTVMADDLQLVQLFQNLIENAVKHRSEDVPYVHVSAEKKKDVWLFSALHNGIKIDQKNKDQISQKFSRLGEKKCSETRTDLSTCKKIVKRHGGKIWVDSEPKKGSTFCFTIPVRGGGKY